MKVEILTRGPMVIGMLFGMGAGTLLALLLGKPPAAGMSFGMGIGVACGVCFDRKQSKRTKMIVAAFFSTVLLAALISDQV